MSKLSSKLPIDKPDTFELIVLEGLKQFLPMYLVRRGRVLVSWRILRSFASGFAMDSATANNIGKAWIGRGLVERCGHIGFYVAVTTSDKKPMEMKK